MGVEAKQLPLEALISLSSTVSFCASALCLNSSCLISQIASATDLAQGKRGVARLMALVGQWWQWKGSQCVHIQNGLITSQGEAIYS